MKHLLTLFLASAFVQHAHAQPTLTFATNAPVVGTQYTLHYGDHVAPGNAGASQSWDLSGLTSDSIAVLELVAPSSTPNATQFPTATVAELSDPVITYYQVNSAGIFFAGSDDGTSIIPNSPAPKFLAFPCTMGTDWSSTFASEFEYDGSPVFRSGTVTGQADGYGTVTMPWGTVPNVLRIHLVNTMQDSMDLFTLSYVYDSYIYYRVGQSYPIAELVTATIDFGFGAPEVTEFSRWTGEISTGIAAPIAQADLRLYPNPATNVVNIVLPQDMGANALVKVIDAEGRTVLQDRVTATHGGTATLDLHALLPGIYTVIMQNRNGVLRTARMAVR